LLNAIPVDDSDMDSWDEDSCRSEYEVKAVLKYRIVDDKEQFFTKWEGNGDDTNN